MKVYINGKRKFSLFGLRWKYDKNLNMIIFRKPLKRNDRLSFEYTYYEYK